MAAKTSYEQIKCDARHLVILIVIYFLLSLTIVPLAKWLFVFVCIESEKRWEFVRNTFDRLSTYIYLAWLVVATYIIIEAVHVTR